MKLAKFLRDEDGGITIDWTVLVAGLMGVGLVVTAEVAQGLEKVTDDYDGITTGKGMMTMFVNNPADPAAEPELTAEVDPVEEELPCNAANPGNDKCVGNAGENPNGTDDWGGETVGRSDG